MARLWRDPGAFRADPAVVPSSRPAPRQSLALAAALLLIVGAVAAVAYLVRPERARAFDLFSGSIFLADSVAPVSVDLATGSPSVRLLDATAQVGATPRESLDLGVTPLAPGGGTLLLDTTTGEFNMVDATGFVVKTTGGVPLPPQPHSWAVGTPADEPAVPDLAYIEQGGSARTSVYLVSQQTVRDAITSRRVRPRAAATLDTPSLRTPGARTAADGSFWLLTGTGASHSVVQLSLPPNSRADGAVLRSHVRTTTTGPTALGSATIDADAGAASAVAVASAGRIEVFAPGRTPRTETFGAPSRVDRILPVTNQSGRLTFLLHATTGWSVVSVNAHGGGLRGPTPISDLSPAASLAVPAQSGDDLYTIDTDSGHILSIGADGAAAIVAGAASYPLVKSNGELIEPSGTYADAYVIARGARVFIDSPSHRDALALFTDGSRAPFVIEKSAAVGLNAAGDAAALSRSHRPEPATTKQGGPRTKPPVTNKNPVNTSVNNAIDCANTTQKPHIPVIYGVQSAARSVTFHWEYPRINNQDCLPRTYVVTTKLESGNAPPPPQAVTVQDQQAITLAGLYPSSEYSITVTAYLGRLSTTSAAVQVQTSAQGPNAPTDLRVRADDSGDWVLDWNSCGTPSASCVPSASWEVQPQICDGNGLVTSLNTLAVQADPTTRRQPTAIYRGGTALLGRGLSFRVLGHGLDNLPGTISASTPCVYSWAPPVPAALSLNASAPPETGVDTTTTAQAVLDLGSDPIRDVGGVGAQVTFTLTGDGTSETKGPFTVDGSTQAVSASFPGVAPGIDYSVRASVAPAHGGLPIVKTADGITTRSDWPQPTVRANCAPTLLVCDLAVQIGNVSSADARGEVFSLINSTVQCGSTSQSLSKIGFDPATDDVYASLSQLDRLYGRCTVTIQLVEDAPSGTTLVYGGTLSPSVTRPVWLGRPATAKLQHDDFQVSWNDQSGTGSYAQVLYVGGDQNLADLTTNWSEKLTGPDVGLTDCGHPDQTQQPGSDPGSAVYIPVDPTCINTFGALPGRWRLTVSYDNKVNSSPGRTFAYLLPGPPPGYQPCTVDNPTAAWGPTQAAGIGVTVGENSDLAGCSSWQYTIDDADGNQICSVSTDPAAGDPPPVTLDTTLCGTPPADGWTVVVQWNDTAGNLQSSGPLPLGPPPSS